jgi:hypothetical protein
MKCGFVELNYLGSDIDGNPPKQSQKDTNGRTREEMQPHDAYALPRLATVSDVPSGRLTRGRHIRDMLRSPWRRRPGLNDLYKMYLADLEASLAAVTEERPQKSDPTALKAVMAGKSVRPRMH